MKSTKRIASRITGILIFFMGLYFYSINKGTNKLPLNELLIVFGFFIVGFIFIFIGFFKENGDSKIKNSNLNAKTKDRLDMVENKISFRALIIVILIIVWFFAFMGGFGCAFSESYSIWCDVLLPLVFIFSIILLVLSIIMIVSKDNYKKYVLYYGINLGIIFLLVVSGFILER